jgi:hypothetical protein
MIYNGQEVGTIKESILNSFNDLDIKKEYKKKIIAFKN